MPSTMKTVHLEGAAPPLSLNSRYFAVVCLQVSNAEYWIYYKKKE